MTGASRPGVRPQLRIVVRVGQAAHVEHHVGVERDAVLVREGLEKQRQARWRAPARNRAPSCAARAGSNRSCRCDGKGSRCLRAARARARSPRAACARRRRADGGGASRRSAGSASRSLASRNSTFTSVPLPRSSRELLRQRVQRFAASHVHAEGDARITGAREKGDELRAAASPAGCRRSNSPRPRARSARRFFPSPKGR